MSLKAISNALYLLRQSQMLEKTGGVVSGTMNVARAIDAAGKAGAKYLASKGHKNLALAARVAPHAAVGYGAIKAKKGIEESVPYQRARAKVQEWRIRKAMKAMQRAQGGY